MLDPHDKQIRAILRRASKPGKGTAAVRSDARDAPFLHLPQLPQNRILAVMSTLRGTLLVSYFSRITTPRIAISKLLVQTLVRVWGPLSNNIVDILLEWHPATWKPMKPNGMLLGINRHMLHCSLDLRAALS